MALPMYPQLQILSRTYKEDQSYREDDSEPCQRSENIIFRTDCSTWHVRVTFQGTTGITRRSGLLRRRKNLEALISVIDFHSLLLPDTVTKLLIRRAPSSSIPLRLPLKAEFNGSMGWAYTIQEDASRVRYPIYEADSRLPAKALSEIEQKEQITNNVFLITRKGGDIPLIYKTVEHPFYDPSYTAIFEHELRNIRHLQGCPNIVQLIAVVKAPNPSKTNPCRESPDVIHGIVLEYHPNGTLEDAVLRRDGRGTAWRFWPKQLAHALLRLHHSSITHMDITSRNVVLDSANEAVLIDIGVGYTYENLAPEFRADASPLDLPFEMRCRNDWWAFEKLLIQIASIGEDGSVERIFKTIGERLTFSDPEVRLRSSEVIQQLSSY